MKKFILSVSILALMLGLFAEELIIGTGTATQRFPLGSFTAYERSAALYTAAEIGAQNTRISALSWYSSLAATAAVPTKIYLKTSSANALTADSWNNMISGATLLYDQLQTGLTEGDWNLFTLQNTFDVDQGQNLMILVERNFGGNGAGTAGGGSAGGGIHSSPFTGAHLTWDANQSPPTNPGSISANRPNVTITYSAYAAVAAPNPAIINSPVNGATLVSPSTVLNWNNGGGTPSGYKLNFGTNNPPSNIVSNLDLEDLTSYNPDPDLAYDSTYYWQIIPYNVFGDATDCPIWSFSTHTDPTIDELPYVQNWDAVTAPNLPYDWNTFVSSTNAEASIASYALAPYSAPNCVGLVNSSDVDAQLYLVSPPFANNLDMGSIRIRIMAKANGNYPLQIGTMSSPDDPGTFVLAQTLAVSSGWNEYVTSLIAHPAAGRFIAFRHGLGGTYRNIYLDDLRFEQIAPNDLAATAISGNTTPSVNTTSIFTIDVFNNGTAAQNTYSVKLMSSSGIELASAAGAPISAGETLSVAIPWAPTQQGDMSIYGKLFLPGDEDALNDETPQMGISVQPEGIYSFTVGRGDQNQRVPWEFFFKNSLFQSLYYQDEMGMVGNIVELSFYNDFATAVMNSPVKIWLGGTLEEDLSAGWIDPSTLTLVYDDIIHFPLGMNTITIPLQIPYTYAGGNLVLYTNRPMDTMLYSSSNYFKGQSIGTNRARKVQSSTIVYNPMSPPPTAILSGIFPQTTFTIIPLSDDPVFVVSPQEYDFGTVLVPNSAQRDISIANAGGGILTISEISISGNAAFTLPDLPALPVSLDFNQNLSFAIKYNPSTGGQHSAQISVTDDVTREVHIIEIFGYGFDSTIYSLPFMENWDTADVPDFPMGWSYIHNSTAQNSRLRTITGTPYSAPNSVHMANSGDLESDLILISPIIDPAINLSSIRIKAMLRGGENRQMQFGTIVDPTDPSTFELAETVLAIANWHEYIINLSSHTGTGRYIAIRHGLSGLSQSIYLDDIVFEEIPPNDLAAIAINGNTTPSLNIATDFTIDIFNNGAVTQDTYAVKLMSGEGVELASAAGPEIVAAETIPVTVSWTPTQEGVMTVYGKVVLTTDENMLNDETPQMSISVQPDLVFDITIGEGDQAEGIPWEFYYRNSLFQTLYYADEFDMFGPIISIAFYNDFTSNLVHTPIKLWLGTTPEADLSAGWIDPATLTLVYDGTITFPSGQNTINIPLDAPFDYLNGNLVLYAHRPLDTQSFSLSDNFLAQTVGTNRSRKRQSNVTVFDPMNPTEGSLSGTFPKTTFFMTADGMGSLSGTVTTAGSPLADVAISIEGTSFETSTSASGEYSFPYLMEGEYTLVAHKITYEDQSFLFSIEEGEATTIDIEMMQTALVNVSGSIVGSDNPTAGLSGGVIKLYGIMNYTAFADANGLFAVEDVLSGNAFDYAIIRAGYQTATGTITVGSADYLMGSITLNELTLPPYDITAAVNDAETAVNLSWGSPGTPGNLYFFDFELDGGAWEPSADWSVLGGDWEYTDSYDVAQWDPSYTGANVAPPNAAHSGYGMWGTKINTNHTSSGGINYLTQTFDFSGMHNIELSFWSWENLLGHWNHAQVTVNGNLVWGPSWAYQETAWQQRIIDLCAYDGMSDVVVRFEMQASSSVNYAGWYIDDVYIGPAGQVARTSGPMSIPDRFRTSSDLPAVQFTEGKASQAAFTRMADSPIEQDHHPSRLPMGYKVWRLENGQESAPSQWISLTPAMIADSTFADPAWANLPDGVYKWAVRTIYIDGVASNPGFSNRIRKQPNDMSALSINGNATPTVDTPTQYTIRIKNTGTSPQTAGAYTVKIMSQATELVSVAGPAIAVNQELDVTVNWSPGELGSIPIYGKVVLPGDSDPTNDQTAPITVQVMPVGQFEYTVGDGSQLANIPVYMYYKSSLFQMIIYPDELSNFTGFLNGIQFYNSFATDLPNKPTRIWIETTSLENLEAGFVPLGNASTLAFDANVDYPLGVNTITILFAEPFLYLDGANLLITVQRPFDTAPYSPSDKFRAQTIGNNRARETHSDTINYDPFAPPTTSTLSGQFPMTTLLGTPGGVGHLSGVVTTGVDNDPLEGALVRIADTGFEAITDAAGAYQIPHILADIYDVQFSKYGYISQTQELVLGAGQEAVINMALPAMPTVPIQGSIVASDTGSGLSGAVVALFGYANYTENTESNGAFSFPAVYANESYEYIISCPGYTTSTGIINVGAAAHQMGTVTLNEIAYAPLNIVAALNASYTAVDLEWEAPDPNALEILESFESTVFPPQNWSQIITNTGAPNTMGVYPTFKRLGAITIAGEPNATPAHGSYQTGLWWSTEHQDEWLITPVFYCPSDAYLRFDSYVFLGSVNGDHYYVKASTDNGNTWQVLWDASVETGGQNVYNSPFIVDLAGFGGQQITLAFQAVDPPSNDGLWYPWFIDNIYIGNANTIALFDGPALLPHSPARSSNMPAAEMLSRDGRSISNSIVKTAAKARGGDNRALTGYEIYRFVSGQEANEASWDLLTHEPISTLTFADDGWGTLPDSTYRWGVKAIYTAGISSSAVLSNPLTKENVYGTIVGFVQNGSGQGIAGATVATGNHETSTNATGAYSLLLPVGIYSVSFSAEGYKTVIMDDVAITPNHNTTLFVTLKPVSGEDELSPVTATALRGNSPNPFNPATTIYYEILEPCVVRLDVYNVKGQKVRSLLNEAKSSGRHSTIFEARDDNGKALGSGIYFYRFTAGNYHSTRKMLLME